MTERKPKLDRTGRDALFNNIREARDRAAGCGLMATARSLANSLNIAISEDQLHRGGYRSRTPRTR